MKNTQLGGCSVRPANDSEGWEILDGDGNSKGKVRLANAFISGVEALLPLEFEFSDGTQEFIVTMHLEDDEWRIDDFGPWEKNDLGLAKLLHQPTEMETKRSSCKRNHQYLEGALQRYASRFPRMGFPYNLRALTISMEPENVYAGKDHSWMSPSLPSPSSRMATFFNTCSLAWEMGTSEAGAAMRSRPPRLNLARQAPKTIWPIRISMSLRRTDQRYPMIRRHRIKFPILPRSIPATGCLRRLPRQKIYGGPRIRSGGRRCRPWHSCG